MGSGEAVVVWSYLFDEFCPVFVSTLCEVLCYEIQLSGEPVENKAILILASWNITG